MIFWICITFLIFLVLVVIDLASDACGFLAVLGILLSGMILAGATVKTHVPTHKDLIYSYEEKVGTEKSIILPGNTTISYLDKKGTWNNIAFNRIKVIDPKGEIYITYEVKHEYNDNKFYQIKYDEEVEYITLEMK